MAKKVHKKKDEFDALESDWKDEIVSKSKDEIEQRIVEIAKAEEDNQMAKKDDLQLKEARTTYSMAGEQYREHTKMAKLRTKFCLRVLRDRGAA